MTNEHPSFDYSQITTTIYLGTNACCRMHFKKELLARGIQADISLESEHSDNPTGVEFFLWLPTVDHTSPSKNNTMLGIETLLFCEENDIPCYVHCKNGHGRGTTLIAAYLIKQKGMNPDEALNYIKERRPSVHLEASQYQTLKDLG